MFSLNLSCQNVSDIVNHSYSAVYLGIHKTRMSFNALIWKHRPKHLWGGPLSVKTTKNMAFLSVLHSTVVLSQVATEQDLITPHYQT